MTFTGFDPDALAFYAELRQNNTKEWWAAHRARFDERVAAPFEQLAEALADEFGEVKVFRPYRDVRFSADKSPYKLQIGMVTRKQPGPLHPALRRGSAHGRRRLRRAPVAAREVP